MADILSNMKLKHPDMADRLETIAQLALQKQTHQLSAETLLFLDAAGTSGISGQELVEFFNLFVSQYLSKMSPINLVRILGKCVAPGDVEGPVGLGLLAKYAVQIAKSKDASVLAKVLTAEIYLKKQRDLSEARTVVDGVSELFQDPIYALSVNASVRGSFHLVASELYLSLGNDLEFYHHLVKFLVYTPLSEIPAETLARTTKQAAVIALVHPEINDFGALLSLPAFTVSGGWILDFLRSIQFGNFDAFDLAVKTHANELRQESDLFAKIDTSLRRKLTMIALAELAGFHTNEKNRRLSFEKISAHCRVTLSEVEELVMTAMGSGGLVEGVIDEVDAAVVISSVKPRVLDMERIQILKSRIESWADRGEQLVAKLAEMTPELVVG
jgi:hypothetical protein